MFIAEVDTMGREGRAKLAFASSPFFQVIMGYDVPWFVWWFFALVLKEKTVSDLCSHSNFYMGMKEVSDRSSDHLQKSIKMYVIYIYYISLFFSS